MYIKGKTISETVYKALKEICYNGIEQISRNGICRYINDFTFEIENPRSRHLFLDGRKNNIFAMIAETIWVLAGCDYIDPYLSFFIPRAKNYSDDGKTWHGAYGPRLYNYNQLQEVVETFKEDGKNTRRAYISITDPGLDSNEVLRQFYELKPKDQPCNQLIHYYITENKFCCKVIQRSGDFIFGSGAINPFEFTFLQELLFNEIKLIFPEVELGWYRWNVTNAHIYESYYDVTYDILKNSQVYINEQNNNQIFGPSIENMEIFFSEIIANLSYIIEYGNTNYIEDYIILEKIFVDYEVSINQNLLLTYIDLLLFYIHSRNNNFNLVFENKFFIQEWMSYEFVAAIVNSSFRKFHIKQND